MKHFVLSACNLYEKKPCCAYIVSITEAGGGSMMVKILTTLLSFWSHCLYVTNNHYNKNLEIFWQIAWACFHNSFEKRLKIIIHGWKHCLIVHVSFYKGHYHFDMEMFDKNY